MFKCLRSLWFIGIVSTCQFFFRVFSHSESMYCGYSLMAAIHMIDVVHWPEGFCTGLVLRPSVGVLRMSRRAMNRSTLEAAAILMMSRLWFEHKIIHVHSLLWQVAL